MKKAISIITHPAFIIPIIFFGVSRYFAHWIALQGNCWAGLEPLCWYRWDSGLYLKIAEHGHELFHCGPEQGYVAGASEWCGTAGWAPLYPFLIRFIHWITGSDLQHIGVNISALFLLGYLFVSAQIMELKNWKIHGWIMMALVAFCPGNIYFHAIYPISMVLFFLGIFYWMLQKNKYLFAGIAAFFAILTYSIGFFILPVLVLYFLLLLYKKSPDIIPFLTRTIIPAGLGLVALFAYDQYATGHWNAMFLIQGKYGHSLHSPLKIFGERLQIFLHKPLGIESWIEIQNFFMILYVFGMAIFLIYKNWKTPFQVFSGIYLFVLWFLPYSASLDVALYRNSAILAPAHSRVKAFPLGFLIVLLGIFLWFSYVMGVLFMWDKLK
ncbi:MAG: hypothetical protein KG003_04740 [Bacteroidetes bacterium]|nr:hypothetical protein [Bacteroidota bacterium]